jgi:hypothetical protein
MAEKCKGRKKLYSYESRAEALAVKSWWGLVLLMKKRGCVGLVKIRVLGASERWEMWRRRKTFVCKGISICREFGDFAVRRLVQTGFYARYEVFTAVTMKNGVSWDVTPCGKSHTA